MNISQNPSEQRWGSRVHLMSAVVLRDVRGVESSAILRNASVGGAFVETFARPALFSRVDIQVAGSTVWIDAWVVRAGEAGIGLEWLEPASSTVLGMLPPPRTARPTATTRWAARLGLTRLA